jgi:hypothetical protein
MLITLLFILSGCGANSDSSTEREDRETVFDPLVSNIDKAKEVEEQVLEHKRQMDEALSKMEESPE